VTVATADSVSKLAITADLDEVRRASRWLEQAGNERGIPSEQILRLDLCLNEVLANIISHGGLDPLSPPVQLSLYVRCSADTHEAVMTVTDTGIPFDPLAYQQKPRPQSLSEAEPGGLGIMMMRDAADAISYRHSEGRNCLAFRVGWDDAA
jgi:anti-sigma regulatory factor (Ser/Thr protein kinase)